MPRISATLCDGLRTSLVAQHIIRMQPFNMDLAIERGYEAGGSDALLAQLAEKNRQKYKSTRTLVQMSTGEPIFLKDDYDRFCELYDEAMK